MNFVTTDSQEDTEIDHMRAAEGAPASPSILIKYGGNAMINPELVTKVLQAIVDLREQGASVVLVHGGGPYISRMLDALGIESEFVGGHRRTDAPTMRYVGMVLSGQVNGEIVARLNSLGANAVGICGRDARMATATRRTHQAGSGGEDGDLGFVGDIERIDPRLVEDLLGHGYLPVVAPISTGPGGNDYNVNADMFAGHLAAAINADQYIVLTDVDGLLRDKDNPESLIPELASTEVRQLMGSVIAGGMIPKVESCLAAVDGGVRQARIVNGTKPERLSHAIFDGTSGTLIKI